MFNFIFCCGKVTEVNKRILQKIRSFWNHKSFTGSSDEEKPDNPGSSDEEKPDNDSNISVWRAKWLKNSFWRREILL